MSALERLCIRTPRAAVPLISLALLQAAHVQGQPFPDVEPGLRQVPADQPAPPGDSFVPPVDGSGPDPGAPVIGQWSPSAEHGQTVVLTGDRFTAPGSAADTEFFFFGQHTAGQPSLEPALIQRMDGDRAAIKMGMEGRAGTESMYLLWGRNDAGYGRPVMVNRAEAWWVGPSKAAAGETVAAFGRNLAHKGGTSQSWVYVTPQGGGGQFATVTSVNPYKVEFRVPPGLPVGSYQVWVHSGHGGDYGWSRSPEDLLVEAPPGYPGAILDVVADFGATADGTTDDYAAVSAAIGAAGPGDTVYFPPGRYVVGSPLGIGSDQVRLLGAGPEVSLIQAHPTNDMPWLLNTVGKSGLTFENLGLEGNRSFTQHKLMRHVRNGNQLHIPFEDLRYLNVRIDTDVTPIAIHGGDRVTVRDSEITAGGALFIELSKQVFIEDNAFYGRGDVSAMILSWALDMFSLAGNTGTHHDMGSVDGWAKRFFAGQSGPGGVQRAYLAHNETTDLGLRPELYQNPATANEGEHILFEGSHLSQALYGGKPVGWSADTMTFADLDVDYADPQFGGATKVLVLVTDGKGAGQIRALVPTVPAAPGVITLDAPLTVPPDGTSHVVLTKSHDRVVIYDNDLDGLAEHVDYPDAVASSGIQLFMTNNRMVVANNRLSDLRWGLSLWTHQQASERFSTGYFNLFHRNSITNTRYGMALQSGYDRSLTSLNAGTSQLGNLFYGNVVDGALAFAYGETAQPAQGFMDMTVLDGNGGNNLERAVDFGGTTSGPRNFQGSATNTVLTGNRFTRGGARGSDGVFFTADQGLPALRRNVLGFPTDFGGALPGPILECPTRRIDLQASSWWAWTVAATLPIWNSGTGTLQWSASSDASWLSVTPTGEVPDQFTAGTLGLSANAFTFALQDGLNSATVTVTAAGPGPGESQACELEVLFTRGTGAGTSAKFLGASEHPNDEGSWVGRYGAQGHDIAGDSSSYPWYANVSIVGASSRVWESSTSDQRALQKASDPGDRVAADWYAATSFEIDLELGSSTRQVTLFGMFWTPGRWQRIDVIDASTGEVLDSQIMTSFGKYMSWLLSGDLKLRVTRLKGPDASISGVFFG